MNNPKQEWTAEAAYTSIDSYTFLTKTNPSLHAASLLYTLRWFSILESARSHYSPLANVSIKNSSHRLPLPFGYPKRDRCHQAHLLLDSVIADSFRCRWDRQCCFRSFKDNNNTFQMSIFHTINKSSLQKVEILCLFILLECLFLL